MSASDRRLASRTAYAARWLTRIGVLAGGWLLLSRLIPASEAPSSQGTVLTDPTGRGRPAEPPSGAARAAGHETGDMNALTMAKLSAGLLVTATVIIGGMVLLNRLLHGASVAGQPHLTIEQVTAIQPPAPNLQADAPADLNHLLTREHALLDTYAWVDPNHSRARIPINRAMTLMVGRPLDTAP